MFLEVSGQDFSLGIQGLSPPVELKLVQLH